jgi:paraquat-inducible protein B
MSKKADPKLIGAFVIGATALLVIGVILFGSGKFFAETRKYVVFFQGSTKGLNVGAPVTLRGVRIGSVTDIKVWFNPQTLSFASPVYIEIEPDRIGTMPGVEMDAALRKQIHHDPREGIKTLVERGLRAKLELQSLVTGQLQVALHMEPGADLTYAGYEKEYQEIPTVPTPLEQLAKTLENIPIREMMKDVRSTLAAVEKLATSPELAESITVLKESLQDFGKLARNVDGRVGPLTSSIEETMRDTQQLVRTVDTKLEPTFTDLQETLKSAQAALENARVALVSISDTFEGDSTFMFEVTRSIRDLQTMAQSVNALADYLQRQPDSLIRGKVSLGR